MSMADRRAELLQDLSEQAGALLRDFGVPETVSDQAANALADYVAEHWGGQVISFPKNLAYRLAQRDREVLAAAQSMTIAALAARFGLGERAVRRLLKRAGVRDLIDNQLSLL